MNAFNLPPGKSGSREVALALLIFWAYITGWLLFWRDKGDVDSYREMYGTITTAIFTFAAAAFVGNAVMQRFPTAPPVNRRYAERQPARVSDGPENHEGAI